MKALRILCFDAEETVFSTPYILYSKAWYVYPKLWYVHPKAWYVYTKPWDIKYVVQKKHIVTGVPACCRRCGTALEQVLGKVAAGAALTHGTLKRKLRLAEA